MCTDAEGCSLQRTAKLGGWGWNGCLVGKIPAEERASAWRSFKYHLATELGHYSAGQGKSRKKGGDRMGEGERRKK